jgi:hypothetical protein
MYKTNILIEACHLAALHTEKPLLRLHYYTEPARSSVYQSIFRSHSSNSFIHTIYHISTTNQPSQLLNNILDHRIRSSLDLQPLRQRQSLDIRIDLMSPIQDCVALLGRPHRSCELVIEGSGMKEGNRRKRGERTTISERYCSRIEGAASGPRRVARVFRSASCCFCLSTRQLQDTDTHSQHSPRA